MPQKCYEGPYTNDVIPVFLLLTYYEHISHLLLFVFLLVFLLFTLNK